MIHYRREKFVIFLFSFHFPYIVQLILNIPKMYNNTNFRGKLNADSKTQSKQGTANLDRGRIWKDNNLLYSKCNKKYKSLLRTRAIDITYKKLINMKHYSEIVFLFNFNKTLA